MKWEYLMQIHEIAKAHFQFSYLTLIIALVGSTYLMKNKDKVVGFAIRIGSYLHYVAVDNKYQGKGLGRKLMAKVMPKIKSLRVNVNNSKAIGLYESLGFRIVSTSNRITGRQHLMKRV